MPLPPKHAPLAAYLRGQPSQVHRLTLTVAEVEAIIGAPLPVSARERAQWANRMRAAPARAAQSAGWRVAAVQSQPGRPLEWTATFVGTALETTAELPSCG